MGISRWTRWACALGLAGCGSDGGPLPPTDPGALLTTLTELAAFEDKRVGTEGGHRAGEYVLQRMQALGLDDVHLEPFHFPRHVVARSSLSVSIDGAAASPGHEVFEGSGAGHADADVVWVGAAHPSDLEGKDLAGKVAMVERDATYHRSAQYRNVSEAGAVGMLYLSQAPRNLIQIGSVRTDGWSPLGPIPTVTIGGDDGATLKAAVEAGRALHAVLDVSASSEPAVGNNVIGRIRGRDAAGEIVLGAHYDTWFTGSGDNGGGVAALLGLAARLAKEPRPRYTLTFVAYDGEEVALYGGYDFLRKHHILASDPILAVLNFEIPSATDTTLFGLARSNHPALDAALLEADLSSLYALYVPMDVVPKLLGGLIPTDIQGIYRNGVPTASTAVDFDYYHTVEDTPDKVDTVTLAQVIDAFDRAVAALGADDPGQLTGLDPKLWTAQLTAQPRPAGDPNAPLVVDVQVADATSTPQPGAQVDAVLLVDDFFPAGDAHGLTDAAGHLTLTLPPPPAQPNRFLHVSAGPTYPFVEQLLPIDD